jgi:rhodanese-related sulfurtransferase
MQVKEVHCTPGLWQRLKRELRHLSKEDFLRAAREWPGAVVLDVRTAAECTQSGYPGARHLDYLHPDFLDQLEALNREAVYLVYCRTGRRSLRVCTLMKNSGFQNVFNLESGWMADGVQ